MLTIISNLALLIPCVRAAYWHRVFRAFIFFWMVWASALYHLCDSFGACLFNFATHHFLDFFFAQLLIILGALYLVHWRTDLLWLEWVVTLLGALTIVVLQITLDGELIVQAGIVGFCFVGLVLYWVIYACTIGKGRLPPYDWAALLAGVALTSGSIVLFSVQNVWPQAYWAAHSLWHVAAAMGQYYLLAIKEPAPRYANAAAKIN